MKKIIILCDLEGCIGIDMLQNIDADAYMYCKECDIVLTTLSSLFPQYKLYVCDCHNNGQILPRLSYAFPQVIFYSQPWNIDFSQNFDYGMFIGFHGHNHTADPLAHSFRPEITEVYLGDNMVGELRIFSNVLAKYNIPTVFFNGSKWITEETSSLDHAVKSCIDHIGVFSQYDLLENAYYELISDLTTLDFKQNSILVPYCDFPVKVQIDSIGLGTYLKKDFNICKNVVCFKNTMDFFTRIRMLCERIGLYQQQRNKITYYIKNLVDANPPNHLYKNETKLRAMLETPISELSLEELTQIYNLLKE